MPSPDQLLTHGITLHKSGRLGEAEAIYRQILAANPNDANALQLLGAIAHQRGKDWSKSHGYCTFR